MRLKIYKPARNAMQSGQAKTKYWIAEPVDTTSNPIDPLMGWTGSNNTNQQLKLRFETKEDALAYAKKHGYEVVTSDPKPRKHNIRPMGYGENFQTNRRQAWTH